MIIPGLLILCSFAAIRLMGPVEAKPIGFMACFLVACLAYLWTLRKTSADTPNSLSKSPDFNLAWLWLVAIGARAMGIGGEVSDDVYRYMWEGMIQQHGYNPYALAPSADLLTSLRPDWHEQINHPELSAAYGPVAQWIFSLASWTGGGTAGWQLWTLAADLGTGMLLYLIVRETFNSDQRVDPKVFDSVRLYLWNPLVIYTLCHRGHLDAFLLLGLAAIFYGLRYSRWPVVLIATTACVNIKFPWIILAPLVLVALPKRSKIWIGFALALLVPWLWYADAGTGLFKTAWHFSTAYHYNDGLPALARWMYGTQAPFVVSALGLAIALAWGIRSMRALISINLNDKTITRNNDEGPGGRGSRRAIPRTSSRNQALRNSTVIKSDPPLSSFQRNELPNLTSYIEPLVMALGIFVLLSPTVHPWYGIWVVPGLALMAPGRWRTTRILMSLSLGLGYSIYAFLPARGTWVEMPIAIRILEHGVLWLAVGWSIFERFSESERSAELGPPARAATLIPTRLLP